MEEKIFELMTKMYSEFSEKFDRVENRLGSVENRLGSVENRLGSVENKLNKLEITIENDIKKDIQMLYDVCKQTYEKLEEVDRKVDNLSSRMEKQEVEIKVIKGGRS